MFFIDFFIINWPVALSLSSWACTSSQGFLELDDRNPNTNPNPIQGCNGWHTRRSGKCCRLWEWAPPVGSNQKNYKISCEFEPQVGSNQNL
jgi:hypothetical protein